MRSLIPLTFVCMAAGVILGVNTFLLMENQPKVGAQRGSTPEPANTDKVATILPEDANIFESLTEPENEEGSLADP